MRHVSLALCAAAALGCICVLVVANVARSAADSRVELGYAAQLYSLRASDGRVRQLTHGPEHSDGVWSPDGRRIAAIESMRVGDEVEDRTAVVLMDALGRHVRRITPLREGGAHAVSWSPDGKLLAVSERDGRRTAVEILRPAGGSARRLTSWPEDDESDEPPAWSPNGRRIAFVREYRDHLPPRHRYGTSSREQFDLELANVRTGALRRFTRTPQDEDAPVWAPDGRTILGTRTAAGAASGTLRLFSVRTGSSRQVGPRVVQVAAAWSPDGRRLALAGVLVRGNRTDHLYVARLNPFRLRELGHAAPGAAEFTPGARELTYDDGPRIKAVRFDGSHSRTLGRLPDAAVINPFDWNPHGATLLLTARVPPPAD